MSVIAFNDSVTQKLIHHFFGKKMKTSLANKNPNKMHHYKNRLKSGYGHMFSITPAAVILKLVRMWK